MLTGAAAAELGVGLDIEALPAWLLRAAVQYLAVHLCSLTFTKLHSNAVHVPKEGDAVPVVPAMQRPEEF